MCVRYIYRYQQYNRHPNHTPGAYLCQMLAEVNNFAIKNCCVHTNLIIPVIDHRFFRSMLYCTVQTKAVGLIPGLREYGWIPLQCLCPGQYSPIY